MPLNADVTSSLHSKAQTATEVVRRALYVCLSFSFLYNPHINTYIKYPNIHPTTAVHIPQAKFAATLKDHLGERTVFFLYDALPHYTVGQWPANIDYSLDLGSVLTMLKLAMANLGA